MRALIAPLFVLALAAVFAKVEVEIEGPDGWAAKLPTWRAPDSWVSHALLDGKPLTGFWFVLNPHYGLAGFNPAKAWWHRPAWWGCLPRGYVVGLVLAIALYAWGSKGSGPASRPDPAGAP